MFIRSSLVLATLALPLAAQTEGDATATFYRAYYLDKEEAKSAEATAKAIALYTRFLTANPSHALAGKAAYNCMILHYSTGKLEAARAFGKTHSALISKVEAAANAARESRRGGGGGGGASSEVAQKLMEAMRDADREGNERGRLMAAMRRVGGSSRSFGRGGDRGSRGGFGGRGSDRGGRGSRGGDRGGRSGGGSSAFNLDISAMKKEEAAKAVEQMVQSAERLIDMMAQRGQADEADAVEAKLDKLQDLVDDGKMKEGQKLIEELKTTLGSSSRRGRGGDQGSQRRRRGGDAGGDTGGERRRRGGDTGTGEKKKGEKIK